MANFTSAGAGFSQGFATGRNIRQNAKALKQQERAQQAQAAQAMRENFAKARQDALKGFQLASQAAKEAAASGADDAAINQLRVTAAASLGAFARTAQELRARAVASGAGEDVLSQLPDPVAFVKQNMPLFDSAVQVGRSQTPAAQGAQAAEEQTALVERIAENLGIPVEQAAQAAGLAPAPTTPREAIVDGRPTFVREEEGRMVEVPGATPIRSGMSLSVGPNGEITLATGEHLTAPTTKTANTLQQSVLDSNNGLSRLFGIQASFKPEFLTLGGKVKAGLASIKDRAGLNLSPEEEQFLTEFSTFATNASNNMNRYIKEITGAQMSEPEADRLLKAVPNPENDGPTQFKAKMDTNIRQLALSRARALHVLREGIDKQPWEVIGLEEMSALIDARVTELEQTLGSREAALAQVSREFGL